MDKLNITLEPNQKIFFSSDQHFGHRNVLKFCDRPFADIKEMGETLIYNWNSVVSDCDIVVTLGDLCWFNDSRTIKNIISKLNGKEIYITLGNHDKYESFHRVIDERFHIIDSISHIFLRSEEENRWAKSSYEIICSHYPLMTWSHRDQGALNLFGHIHSGNRTKCELDQDLPLWPNMLDVGVDNQEYTPISFEDVLKQLERT